MYGKHLPASHLALAASIFVLIFAMAAPVQAERICTFKGVVTDQGWRTMQVRSGAECATVNVGWKTKFIPNRRPCIGERVAVDFALSEGYMKATKVVSLSPIPGDVSCYPPPPPGSSVCRTEETAAKEEVCTPPKPVCSRTPPPHVSDRYWPGKKKEVTAKKEEPTEPVTPTKPPTPPKRVAKVPTPKEAPKAKPKEEPREAVKPPKEEVREPAPVEEKGFKSLTGEVVATSPKSLSIRVTEEGGAADLVNVNVGLKTKFEPFRRPAVGEKVKVNYREENGGKFGYTVKVVQ
ncbi:MAG: hypothetical protein FJ118_15085 [Deltaproteobacteria bacterium]|nr:hypothetical protein [Deltaproteobacteria bacterium]